MAGRTSCPPGAGCPPRRGKEAGVVAGCRVTDGSIRASLRYRVLRGGEVVHTGTCASLKRHKLEVEAVGKGTECGVLLEGFDGVQPGDVLQCISGGCAAGALSTTRRAVREACCVVQRSVRPACGQRAVSCSAPLCLASAAGKHAADVVPRTRVMLALRLGQRLQPSGLR